MVFERSNYCKKTCCNPFNINKHCVKRYLRLPSYSVRNYFPSLTRENYLCSSCRKKCDRLVLMKSKQKITLKKSVKCVPNSQRRSQNTNKQNKTHNVNDASIPSTSANQPLSQRVSKLKANACKFYQIIFQSRIIL